MKNGDDERIEKKIAELDKEKIVSWIYDKGKIFLRFKIDFSGTDYDCVMMAAFEYKKGIKSLGDSQYAIEFECDEENLEMKFMDAANTYKNIIEEARNIPDREYGCELEHIVRTF